MVKQCFLEKDLIDWVNNFKIIVIYGAGNWGECLASCLGIKYGMLDKIRIAVTDCVGMQELHGKRIENIRSFKNCKDALIIIAASPIYHREMEMVIKQNRNDNYLFMTEELYADISKRRNIMVQLSRQKSEIFIMN